MSERLAEFYDAAQEEARAREAELPFRELEWIVGGLSDLSPRFVETIVQSNDVAVIAEHKRKSPSNKRDQPTHDLAWTVDQYRRGGAAALSVVTQGLDFDGGVEDLGEAIRASDSGLPILRKDFIRNFYQIYESKAFGADAVLLIAAGLSDKKLFELYKEARDIGLDCLVEVHDEKDLSRALEVEPSLIGINNRDLDSLEVDLNTTRELIEAVPSGIPVMAESGYNVRKRKHMRELREIGAKGVLLGTSLMRDENPAEALAAWLEP
jgi:indole-3-glycerol phosphate synthase